MAADPRTVPTSNAALWTGYVLSGLPSLFLLLDGVGKLLKPDEVVKPTLELGFPESSIVGLGILLIVCVAIYLFRRTGVLGAVLLTGYLGGAVATHVRVQQGLFPVFFPVIVGALLWGGLYLRDARLRALIPLRSRAA